MLSLAAAIASPEAIVQAKPNHVEAIVEGCVERRGACWRAAAAEGGDGANGNSCESHCFGAQIDKSSHSNAGQAAIPLRRQQSNQTGSLPKTP
jgi:hypothetical protein